RGFFHFALELFLHLGALACQEIARGPDLVEVLVARDVPDARRGAILQVRVKTMAVVALGRRERTAPAQMKLPADERERAAERAGVRERTEVARAVVLLEAREREARDRIVQVHLQHQEPFVVAKADVVARMKFL